MRGLAIIFFLISFNWGFSQSKTFKAQFKSLVNGEEILYAKVAAENGSTKLTNIDGYVSIKYYPGEIITISHLTFDTLKLNPERYLHVDTPIFYLKPRVYTLKEFKFSVLGPRAFFDNKFVKNDLGKSDEEKVREKLKIIEMRQELIGLDLSAQSGVVLGSPISYLYDRFSKAGREKQKYNLLIERDRRDSIAGKKFDNLIVKMLTSYNDDEVAKFVEFCSLHPTYVEQVDALSLYYEILRCKDQYEE